jgi:hypothetical protein
MSKTMRNSKKTELIKAGLWAMLALVALGGLFFCDGQAYLVIPLSVLVVMAINFAGTCVRQALGIPLAPNEYDGK